MRFSTFVAALLPVGIAFAQGIHNVSVGFNGTLTYMPPSINASVGDVILFTFESKNHTVTQSSFAAPCQNISADPIDSGFQFIPANSEQVMLFNFTVTNASTPLWFYCRQTGHCEQGMVFAINPPATGAKTFAAFQAAAKATNATNSTAASTSSSASTKPSTTSSTGTGAANGANALRFGGVAGVLAALGVVAGVLL